MTLAFQSLYVGFFVGVLGLAGLGLLAAGRFAPAWSRRVVPFVAVVGVAALAVRTIVAGHLPIFGTFENTLTAAACFVVAAAFTSRLRTAASAWAWAAPWSLVLLLYGTRFRQSATPLTISEQSLWVDVHVVFAWLAFVSLALASSIAVVSIAGGRMWGMEADAADETTARLLNVGFLALTATILVGAWYLWVLFAEFWRWEIVGTLSLAAWLGYGMVIHARYFYRLGGRRLAAAVLAVLPLLVLAFWVWSAFPGTYHYFDILLLKAY